jgi:hypothetical protein
LQIPRQLASEQSQQHLGFGASILGVPLEPLTFGPLHEETALFAGLRNRVAEKWYAAVAVKIRNKVSVEGMAGL